METGVTGVTIWVVGGGGRRVVEAVQARCDRGDVGWRSVAVGGGRVVETGVTGVTGVTPV